MTMKKAMLLALVALIALPTATHAFSLDAAIQQWISYMRTKVDKLEKENAQLRSQLSTCGKSSLPAETSVVSSNDTDPSDEDVQVEVKAVRQTSYPDGAGGVYGSYEVDLAITAADEDIYIPRSTNDTVGAGTAGITYKIRGDDTFKGRQGSQVSCSRRSEGYCKIGDGTTGTITTTVWLYPSEGSDGNYSLSFDKLTYFMGDDEQTADIDAKTASINLYY